MRLDKRVADLVRALARSSPGRSVPLASPVDHSNRDGQMEQVRRSLAEAEARRRLLEDELAAAEQSGHTRAALRLRRNLEEMSRSTERLQAMLEVIEERIEAAHQVRQAHKDAAALPPSPGEQSQDVVPLTSGTAQKADLEARRLSWAGQDADPPES